MYYLARWCHLGPAEVDRLRVPDFAALVNGIDTEIEAREREAARAASR